MHTDGSSCGLGAVLCQEQKGKIRPIAYRSHSLNSAEKKYLAHKVEFLAQKWTVTEKYHDYLYGHDFEVITDNNPLTYVLNTARLDATGHRWLAALSAYNYTTKYRPGKRNGDADGLSRLPACEEFHKVCKDVLQAICTALIAGTWAESCCMSFNVVDNISEAEDKVSCVRNWRRFLKDDSIVGAVHKAVSNGKNKI